MSYVKVQLLGSGSNWVPRFLAQWVVCDTLQSQFNIFDAQSCTRPGHATSNYQCILVLALCILVHIVPAYACAYQDVGGINGGFLPDNQRYPT